MVRFHGRAYIVATAVLMSALVAASSSHCAPIEQVVVASKVVARIASPGEYGSLLQRVAKIDQRVTQAISVEDVGSPRMPSTQAMTCLLRTSTAFAMPIAWPTAYVPRPIV